MIYLEMCIENLIYAKEELESSGTPFYLEEMKRVLTRLIILENDIDNFASDNQNLPDVSLVFRSPPKVQKKYADFEYVFRQIEGALVELDVQGDFCEDEWFWLTEEMMEVTDMLVNLYEDIVAVKKLVDVLTSFNFTPNLYDFLTYYQPQFKDIIQKLKNIQYPVIKHGYIADPRQKELPRPKRGPYRKGRQTFTTFSTGSNAMLILQGTHLKADRSHLSEKKLRK
ncbi:hypothetical protein QNH36_22180 [Mesobacillus sp. AQ2]|uniref:hypothetical protein n=1 Tax=Mesobacillus sp. AQ2 TaxID=3043332 RepID=UPI0024C1EDAD|nr:hypothetical protein [Mesobacillus sp. AQ2]WHX40317.1 hypothetical protein QNH36_22180 [Mesobacillus sp. AQ2]